MAQARYVGAVALEGLLDPEGAVWRGAARERVPLIGTPLGLQPTPAIMASWATKKIGKVEQVEVAAAHNGRALAVRLEWEDASENGAMTDTTMFVDAAGVLFPAVPGAPMPTMGAPGQSVNAWYWRADENDRGRHVVAEGLGTTRTVDEELVRGHGVWKGGRWAVVIARALWVETAEAVVQLTPGEATQYGVAIWEGSHGERAGLKGYSTDWRELVLEAAPQARR